MPNAMSNLPQPPSPRAFDDGAWLKQTTYCPVCRRWVTEDEVGHASIELPARLWIYTNYDCNLSCSYCLVSSNPWAERRGIGLDRGTQLLDEAAGLGVNEVFFTGGEPFILPEDLSADLQRDHALQDDRTIERDDHSWQAPSKAARRQPSESLHPGQPRRQRARRTRSVSRCWKLEAGPGGNPFTAVVGSPGTYRHHGDSGCMVRIPAVRAFVRDDLGIADEHHIVRPLLKRGFAETGLEVARSDLVPEMTVDANGVYWHPVGTDADLLVTSELFPLRAAIERIATLSQTTETAGRQPFR